MNVIAIVGPTASGKSALALRAAERAGGEIVSADSRQVYRGMDIGTAKPSLAAQRAVRHHCIDLVDPGELYDAARYQRDARAALADIASRGLTAYLVGGTGLYVRALLDGLALDAAPTDPALRAMLEARAELEGGPALHRELARIDPAAAERVDERVAGGVPLTLGHAWITIPAAATRAVRPTRLVTTQASRNTPFVRSTAIHAHADRQIRTTASAVVTTSSGAAIRTQSLISGLPSGAPISRAVIAMAPRIRTGTDSRT
jgi:hypothetical protein